MKILKLEIVFADIAHPDSPGAFVTVDRHYVVPPHRQALTLQQHIAVARLIETAGLAPPNYGLPILEGMDEFVKQATETMKAKNEAEKWKDGPEPE